MKMFFKKRDEPIALYQLQALVSRLPNEHGMKSKVQKELKNKLTEIRGINTIDFPLRFIKKQAATLNDIRIEDENGFFQIDILLLNQKFILILEVKNWYGTILFDGASQVIRIKDNDEEEGFTNPITQAKLQRFRLQQWLDERNFTKIPIYFLIVFSFPSTIIKQMTPTSIIPKEVIHRDQLLFTFNQLNKNNIDNIITNNELQYLAESLAKSHVPRKEDFLKKYHIDRKELMNGVMCPHCLKPTMGKKYTNWICIICNQKSTNAHLQAISDYKYLISNTASNKELRSFLQIPCRHVMKRLLKKGRFVQINDGVFSRYEL